MTTKKVGIILVLAIALTGITCKKKISKYPFDMNGVWYASDAIYGGIVLVIEKNGNGKIFSDDNFGGTGISAKGKVKYKKDILYVDKKKFTIFDEPKLVASNDSIEAPDENDLTGTAFKTYKVIAKMTLKEKGILTFKTDFDFKKYVDY